MTPLATFQEHRRALVGIAYRMLGSASEAEDVVQDAWLRWQSTDHAAVRSPRAWLHTTVTRLCVDRLGTAAARHETYTGTWLPEPVLTTSPLDLDSISQGFLVLLERLNASERAVFLLHQVFDYSHAETAEILGLNEAASRQLLHRAKLHIAEGKPRHRSNRARHEQLLAAFLSALTRGDIAAITSVLSEDATLYGDGGGKVRGAILKPIQGSHKIARFFTGLVSKAPLAPDLVVEVRDVNGWPALIGSTQSGVSFVVSIETDGAGITTIFNVVSPEKPPSAGSTEQGAVTFGATTSSLEHEPDRQTTDLWGFDRAVRRDDAGQRWRQLATARSVCRKPPRARLPPIPARRAGRRQAAGPGRAARRA